MPRPVQNKETQKAVAPVVSDIPQGLDPNGFSPAMDDLPEDIDTAPEVEEEAPSLERKPTGKNSSTAEKSYEPSEKVLNSLSKLPKYKIKEQLGIDLDKLIANTKKYGVLEALAYGRYTPQPLNVSYSLGNVKKNCLATVRILSKDDQLSWDIHETSLRYKLDENGNRILKPGKLDEYEMEYFRNELTESSRVKLYGKELTQDQVRHLMYTGNLGEVVTTAFNGNIKNYLVSVDPYNKHELITTSTDQVAKALENTPKFVYDKKEYPLSPRNISELMLGKGQWLKGGDEKYIYVQWDCASCRLKLATEYKAALSKAKTQSQAPSEAQAPTVQNSNGLGKR